MDKRQCAFWQLPVTLAGLSDLGFPVELQCGRVDFQHTTEPELCTELDGFSQPSSGIYTPEEQK